MEEKGFSKVILGIDPGTRITGYGLVRLDGSTLAPLDFGCIRPPIKLSLAERYLIIFNGLEHLLEKYSPDAVSVELQFVDKNVQSALKLGMVRGVVLLACAKWKVPIFEYAPTRAKRSIAGSGSASKATVQKMVQLLLKLEKIPEPEDAADALALAVCHANTMRRTLCTNILEAR